MVESNKLISRQVKLSDQVGICVSAFVLSFLIFSSSALAQNSTLSTTESKNAKTENAPIADKWALIVGISKYQDKNISLPAAIKDAQKFAEFLKTKGNFAADHIKVLLDSDATRNGIMMALGRDWLPQVARENDLIVVYFRAGGSPSNLDAQGVNYLLAADSTLDDLYVSGIALQDLPRVLKERIHARHLVAIADADYSASILQESRSMSRSGSPAQHVDTIFVAACGKDQRSGDDKNGSGSIFTKHLIEALQLNGETTKFSSAFEQLAKNVQAEAKQFGKTQTPEMKSTWNGDLVFLAKPNAPRPVPKLESSSAK